MKNSGSDKLKPVGTAGRLESLDAIRGFDMLWIVGLGGVCCSIGVLLPGGADSWLCQQMQHVEWNGLHLMDMVYPLFLFIAGISFPFSISKQIARGDSAGRIHLRILKRAALLMALGIIYNGSLASAVWPTRWASVLGRIGLSWAMAAIVYLHCGLRTRIGVIAMLLAVYAAVLLWCASPLVPSGTDPMSLEGCFMGYLDRFLTPGTLNEKGVFAPSGVPMSAVSVGTALLGMCAGDVVRAARWDGPRKTAVLLGLGVALLAAGLAVSAVIPINKKLWSPSYTLVAGGASFALFAAFYWLIDVRGWRSWALPLRWVGTNAIAMYFAHALLPFDEIARRLVGFAAGLFPEPSLVITLGDLALTLLMARFLYRQKVFFKV